MNDYERFLQTKEKGFIDSGFNIDEDILNSNLFDFQKYAVKIALEKGKFAMFFDCGLGKTIMQLSWAHQVNIKTNRPVLILAPLAVTQQTIEEGSKFNIQIEKLNTDIDNPIGSLDGIFITNYEQLKNIDATLFDGIVLDESSILKGRDGNDEKHICPLQLDTIDRIVHLYSNEGETVLSTFGGIGSEGVQAIELGRKSISIELKNSYFNLNTRHHKEAIMKKGELTLF